MIKDKYMGSFANIDFKLGVYIFFDEGYYIAYCPSLDLTAYGETEKNAKDDFKYQIKEYFNYTIENGTLDEELRKQGWRINQKEVKSPTVEFMVKSNNEFKDILENKEYNKYNETFAFA